MRAGHAEQERGCAGAGGAAGRRDLLEYEVDTEAIHTDAPGLFAIVYVTPQPEGVDRCARRSGSQQKDNPLIGPAFDSFIDYSQHRDELLKGNGAYK